MLFSHVTSDVHGQKTRKSHTAHQKSNMDPLHGHRVCVSREAVVSGLGFNKPSDFWPLETYWGDILGG